MINDYEFGNRRFFLVGGMLIILLIFVGRLFYLQVLVDDYKAFADSNAFLKKTQYPSRGMMYDRNGKLLVYNQPAYEVMMIMREVAPFDTLDFCQTLGITKEQFDKRISDIKDRRLNPGYSSYTPQLFLSQLSAVEYGALQEKLYRFPGFYSQNRTIREYAFKSAALVLGNIGEVSPSDIKKDNYYVQGDESGRFGLEKSYEQQLRGEKGVEILLRDAHGRIKGRYENGKHDKMPVSGKNLSLTLDVDLQMYGELLMSNKIGAIVAIEPATGEILAMVSSPSYDPSILLGRQRGKNYAELQKNVQKPLLNRPIMSAYPPGSTFKVAQALVFLEEDIITTETTYPCSMGFYSGNFRLGCHAHASPLNLPYAVSNSCNAYFCYGLKAMLDNRRKYPRIHDGLDRWRDMMVDQGFGYPLGIDLPSEKRGLIPNSTYYSKIYGERRWNPITLISISIGQGEILATPLQICNFSATIANRGWFVTPHLVKKVENDTISTAYVTRRYTNIDPIHYQPMVEGMHMAVEAGTARIGRIDGIPMAGKTGTAQNPHGRDHSIFMGFAPVENPQIAIAVYVENAGFGATYAVPIASLMVEKYITGSVNEQRKWVEDRMIQTEIDQYSIRTPYVPPPKVNAVVTEETQDEFTRELEGNDTPNY